MAMGKLGAGGRGFGKEGSTVLGRAGVPAASTTGIIAANRAQVPTVLIPAVPSPFTSRRSHYASTEGAISALQTVDFGYYIADTMLIAATGITYTIKRYIEYPAGVFTQVTWGGATSKSITYASAVFVSDPVAVTIPAGAKFWERTVHISGVARDIPGVEMPAIHTTLGLDDGNVSADQGNTGTIAAGSGTNTIGSVAIIGTVAKANARAFVAFGDSLTWGFGDITSVGSKGGSGWISRGLDPLYPWLKVAKNNIRADQVAAFGAQITNLMAAVGFTDVITALGTNDLSQGTGTPSTILANDQTIYNTWASGKRLYLNTLLPRSTSTDSYATVVNQTSKTDGNWTQAVTLNGTIRGGAGIGQAGYFESADIAMSARNSGVWAAPPAPTTDGTHPNSTSAAAIAAAVVP